jgi:hypothetical protein
MKIYIAAQDQEVGRLVAEAFKEKGHQITSTWLDLPFRVSSEYSEFEKSAIAHREAEEVMSSDALVLVACSHLCPGGKFVEAGIAIGSKKPVYLLGRRENLLMWLPGILQLDSLDRLTRMIG